VAFSPSPEAGAPLPPRSGRAPNQLLAHEKVGARRRYVGGLPRSGPQPPAICRPGQ
jgi:hypothetical protein